MEKKSSIWNRLISLLTDTRNPEGYRLSYPIGLLHAGSKIMMQCPMTTIRTARTRRLIIASLRAAMYACKLLVSGLFQTIPSMIPAESLPIVPDSHQAAEFFV